MTQISDWKIKTIPLGYRLVTLSLAAGFIFSFNRSRELVTNPLWLIGLAAADIVLCTLTRFIDTEWRKISHNFFLSAMSAVISIILVQLSGGIESPFLLYSLAPVLSIALFSTKRDSIILAAFTSTSIIVGDIVNPIYRFQFSPFSTSQMAVYVVAGAMLVTLPYIVNINLKKRLEEENIQAERQRLSREIHDGIAQTLHALCWQVQQVRHEMGQPGVKEKDIEQLEKLAERARADILQAMAALRNQDDENDFRTILTDCLEDFKQTNNIDYHLDLETGNINPSGEVKKELVSICREALANIKKHSGAFIVQVRLRQVNDSLEFSIADDGRGFDAVSYYRRRFEIKDHHGLAMMQERASLINGTLQVLSMPEHGTEIRLAVPLRYVKG